MLRQKIFSFIAESRVPRTLLGVGVVSRNTVDAAVELANEHQIPILLIASRRQIDSAEFGGGYAGGWDTGSFARYVRQHDVGGYALLARDHGGPWQHPMELQQPLTLDEAMRSALSSFRADLEAGFDFLHVDTSIDPGGLPRMEERTERAIELHGACAREAARLGRDIVFEIGTEEQGEGTQVEQELEYSLGQLSAHCRRSGIAMPLFVVVQTGTLVKECYNVGTFERDVDSPQLRQFLDRMNRLCGEYGVLIKEHNCDYLSDYALSRHPALGIHAANVAPEFAIVESRALIRLLRSHGLHYLALRFIALAHQSDRWNKWMLPESRATEEDKAVLAGHYVYTDPRFLQIKEEASQRLSRAGVDLEAELKAAVKLAIARYLVAFGLIASEAPPPTRSLRQPATPAVV